MLRKISNPLLKLIIEENLIPHKVNTPLSIESLYKMFTYFEEKEVFLSQDKTDGILVDDSYLNSICSAVNELLDPDDIDITDLNNKIEAFLQKNSQTQFLISCPTE